MAETALKPYVAIDDESCPNREVLRARAAEIKFPLSDEDKAVIDDVMARFNSEKNMVGLAAPQIGYAKRIIIIHTTEDMKQIRDDVHDLIPPTLIINPEFEPIGEHKTLDWEGCFSVLGKMGEVLRYTAVKYKAYNRDGKMFEGSARGLHARVIQHEIGHLNGQLMIDLIRPEHRSGPVEEMRALRTKEREARKKAKAGGSSDRAKE